MSKRNCNTSAPVTTMVPNEAGELEVVAAETVAEEVSSEPAVEGEQAPKKSRKRGVDESDPFMKQIISRVSNINPKRKGSKSFARFAFYKEGMTVGEFLKAGGTRGDINWDTAHEHITVIPAARAGEAVEVQEEASAE